MLKIRKYGKLYTSINNKKYKVYQGEFNENNFPSGYGKLYGITQDYVYLVYKGKFKDGNPHGDGIVYNSNKEIIYSGKFHENKFSLNSTTYIIGIVKK